METQLSYLETLKSNNILQHIIMYIRYTRRLIFGIIKN